MKKNNLNLLLILDGCRKGNRQSQRKLYEHFYGYGMNICLRFAKNVPVAQEMLNDGFLKIFKNLDKYDPDHAFKAWLRKVMVNACVDYYRKYKKKLKFTDLSGISEVAYSEAPQVYVPPGEDVLPEIQKLSPAYRLVFNLYVMEGYKHHEIAEMLGISVGASKSNLARAKAKLRIMIAEKNDKKAKRS